MILTVIIPVFNERKTIKKIITKVKSLKKLKKQIIIVDDFSTDGTKEILKKTSINNNDKIIFHKKNKGKGGAIISAKKFIKGDIVIIQDADLEYDPKDYYKLINPIKKKKIKVVYGSRVLGKKRYKSKNFISKFRIFANHMLTIFSNIINRQSLTDAHTCYKVFDAQIFKKINLKSKDFAFCPEVTTKLSNMNIKILEIPIRYRGRGSEQGKKIQFKDGIYAICSIIKYKFFIFRHRF